MLFSNLKTLSSKSANHEDSTATFVREFVDALFEKCIASGASDLHLEPYEDCFRIRYRVDGTLSEISHEIDSHWDTVTSRIKVMARLNIAEARIPQDGRIQIPFQSRIVDTRVSTLPTKFGESVVVRFLDQSKVVLSLNALGMPNLLLSQLRQLLNVPSGIFLTTGPTGSGKTTTLYSLLSELNTESRKILTAEDPVEYEIDGIVQAQTRSSINLGFGRLLRSFLRHDPDTILVGEIRDLETANIAIQASLTGHLVFSSLHTNDAPGAVARLVDLGIEPYLLAASLIGVLAQRLVRRLDLNSCEVFCPTDEQLASIACTRKESKGRIFYRPKSDLTDENSAYSGRVGLWELLVMDDVLREAITSNASHLELKRIALNGGMVTLRKAGVGWVLEGKTSIDEISKHT